MKLSHILTVIALLASPSTAQETPLVSITPVTTGVNASLRGLAMRGSKEAWATGSGGTVVRTLNGGKSWQEVPIPHDPVKDAEGKLVPLDFRDVELLPDGSVLLMSIGNGSASKLFHSRNDRGDWQVVLENQDEKGFFDGIAFAADGKRGLLFGDPLNGRLDMYLTSDAGRTWQRVPEGNRPRLKEGEYGFAASGTGAVIFEQNIYIATGGSVARLHVSRDGGKTWAARKVPFRSGNASSGIFSIAFADKNHGVAVGGDYLEPSESAQNVAVTFNGGESWLDMSNCAMPHKACVCFLGKTSLLTCGRTGIAVSVNGGRSWQPLSAESYYACVFDSASGTGFLAGKDGRVAQYRLNK